MRLTQSETYNGFAPSRSSTRRNDIIYCTFFTFSDRLLERHLNRITFRIVLRACSSWRISLCGVYLFAKDRRGRRVEENNIVPKSAGDWRKHQKPTTTVLPLLRVVSPVQIPERPAMVYHRPKMKNKYDGVGSLRLTHRGNRAKRKRIVCLQGVRRRTVVFKKTTVDSFSRTNRE